jgi:hypothetical protein
MKWCSGSCGRLLRLQEYDLKPGNYRQSECRRCRNIRTRGRLRLKYRLDSAFRSRVCARMKAAYWSNPQPRRDAVAIRSVRLKAAS